jgi:hypothetical protein
MVYGTSEDPHELERELEREIERAKRLAAGVTDDDLSAAQGVR